MICAKCGETMDQTEKDTSSGRDIREYKCSRCGYSDWEDRGDALWKILHDDREEFEASRITHTPANIPDPQSVPSEPQQDPARFLWSRLLAPFRKRFPDPRAGGLRLSLLPPKKSMLTNSCGNRRSQSHPAPEETNLAWRYADNGFATSEAMDSLHQPIVALVQGTLASKTGNVLDLGCGNGTLLAKICAGRSDLIPYGIDVNDAALEHAGQLLPDFVENFVKGDLFDVELWASGNRTYTLTLLMIGRLLEVPRERAMKMLDCLRVSSSHVLVYTYDTLERSLDDIASQFGVTLATPHRQIVAFIKDFRVG
jgi:hypothetical protein